jgi:hypothetical protein
MTCGDHAWRQGDVARAVRHWQRALVVRSELGDRRGIGGSIERLAWALAASDLFELAAWLFGAAESQHRLLGIELWHHEKIDHDHLVAVTHQHLGEAFAEIFSAGNGSSVDEAVVRGVEGTRSLASDGQAKLPRKLRMLSATPQVVNPVRL